MAMLAPAAIPLMLAGGAVSAVGAYTQGQNAQAGYNYKAGVAQVNKKIAEQNRDYAYAAGSKEATRVGQAGAQRMGKIITAQAASGIDVTRGSARDVQESQRGITQADERQVHDNAARRAYGFSVQAENYENESRMLRKAGSDASTAGTLGAISSLIGTATSVAGKWYQGSQSGLFGGGSADPWRGLRENDIGTGSSLYSMA